MRELAEELFSVYYSKSLMIINFKIGTLYMELKSSDFVKFD